MKRMRSPYIKIDSYIDIVLKYNVALTVAVIVVCSTLYILPNKRWVGGLETPKLQKNPSKIPEDLVQVSSLQNP